MALLDVATPAGLAAAERLLRHGSDVGMYIVALAPSGGDAGHALFGARVTLGVEVTDDETRNHTTDRGSVLLHVPGAESVSLEPVLVRRDTSRRWLAGASTPGATAMGALTATPAPLDLPIDGGEGGPAPAPEPEAGAFDWHRAIFDDPGVTPKATPPEPRNGGLEDDVQPTLCPRVPLLALLMHGLVLPSWIAKLHRRRSWPSLPMMRPVRRGGWRPTRRRRPATQSRSLKTAPRMRAQPASLGLRTSRLRMRPATHPAAGMSSS